MSIQHEARTAAAADTVITLDAETHQGLQKLLSAILESTGYTFSESDVVRMGLRRVLKEARKAEFNGKKMSRRVLAGEIGEYAMVENPRESLLPS